MYLGTDTNSVIVSSVSICKDFPELVSQCDNSFVKIYNPVNRLRSFLLLGHSVTLSLCNSVSQSLNLLVTSSLGH